MVGTILRRNFILTHKTYIDHYFDSFYGPSYFVVTVNQLPCFIMEGGCLYWAGPLHYFGSQPLGRICSNGW